MGYKFRYIIGGLVAAIICSAGFAVAASSPTQAAGEKWVLTERTTLQASGGGISGTITLKPRYNNGRADPSVWISTTDHWTGAGDKRLCVVLDGLVEVDKYQQPGTFSVIRNGYCDAAPGSIQLMGSISSGLDNTGTFTSNVPGSEPSGCGSPGFVGPCPETNCDTLEGTAKSKCLAVKGCKEITGDEPACSAGFDACLATWPADQQDVGSASCQTAIAQGNMDTGNYSEGEGEGSSCAIDGVGWILCPVMNFVGFITDASYEAIELLLNTPASLFDTSQDTGQATRQVWSIMRNIANVSFVIGFIIIIYSQITSIGISNYGVKKLLPKLIIAAILVNLSFFICAIAVDISNILGQTIKGLVDSVSNSITVPDKNIGAGTTLWTNIIGGVIATATAGAVISYLGVSVLFPVLIAALVAVVTVVVVLVLRQALIILMVVVSPLAFVALLLPNTETWFKKWRSLFFVLLLMFPAVALIFGVSALAGKIVMLSSDNVLVQIAGAGITIIPLFITPVLMKTAGGVLNRFAGIVNNADKGIFDNMKNRAKKYRDTRQAQRGIQAMTGGRVFGGGQFRRRARREAIQQGAAREESLAKSSFIANEITDNETFRNQVAGGSLGGPLTPNASGPAMSRALANATMTVDKATAENIQAEAVLLQNASAGDLLKLIRDDNTSQEKKSAAMQRLITVSDPKAQDENGNEIGYAEEVNKIIANGSADNNTLRRATAEALGKNGPGFLKSSDIDQIASGAATNKTLESIAQANAKSGVLSQQKLVEGASGDLSYAFETATALGQKRLQETALAALTNPDLQQSIKHNRGILEEIATRPLDQQAIAAEEAADARRAAAQERQRQARERANQNNQQRQP